MKKILFIIAGFVFLVIIAALVAPFFISADTYKEQIKSRVEAATGRTMTIDGPLSLHFFPVASVSAEQITLSNPSGFNDKQPFLIVKKFNVDIEVLPLLHNDIVIKDFELVEPQVNLQVNKEGEKNWLFTKARPAMPIISPPKGAIPPSSSPTLPNNFMLNNLLLKDGQLVYTNAADATNVTLTKLNAKITLSSTATAALIEGSGEWNGKTVKLNAGIGTLKSMAEEQKMEFKIALTNDLFNVDASGNYDHGAINGKGNVTTPSVKALMAWLEPAGKPLATPAKLALNADSEVHYAADTLNLPNLHLTLDDLQTNGSVKVNLGGSVPDVDMELNTSLLDINPFLPSAQHASLTSPSLIPEALAESGERWSDAAIDVSALKNINVNATIKASSIVYRKITVTKTALSVKLAQGNLSATIADAALYSGTGSFSATVNSNQSPPVFESHIALKSVQLEPLLKDAADFDRLTGVADIDIATKSSGNSEKAIISALSGDGKIKLANGTIKRINIAEMLRNTAGAFTETNNTSKNTNFTQIAGSFTIAQGVISNHDLTAELQGLNVAGDGAVNLPAYTINYHLSPKLVATAQDKTTGVKTTKEGLSVPVIIEGNLDKPNFRPDLNAAVQEALSDPKKFKENLKNTKAALKDQFKGGGGIKNLKGLLQGLGGN